VENFNLTACVLLKILKFEISDVLLAIRYTVYERHVYGVLYY